MMNAGQDYLHHRGERLDVLKVPATPPAVMPKAKGVDITP
jgi:hypothetical protein